MAEIQILHNNRCTKSRNAVNWLTENNKEFEIIEYLKTPLAEDEIKSVLVKLDIPAEALLRKGEAIFKENYKGKTLSEEEWIKAMAEHPKLIERPIVIIGKKAVIGRPIENITKLF